MMSEKKPADEPRPDAAKSGRWSASSPNLQNIPTSTADERRIRQAFVAPADGMVDVTPEAFEAEMAGRQAGRSHRSLLDGIRVIRDPELPLNTMVVSVDVYRMLSGEVSE